MRIVYWSYTLTFHHSALLRALARRGHRVGWVSYSELYERRKQQGWPVPDTTGVEVWIAPSEAKVLEVVRDSPSDSVHIFHDAHVNALATPALREAMTMQGITIGLVLESREYWGGGFPFSGGLKYGLDRILKGAARYLRYRRFARLYDAKASFILIGGGYSSRQRRNFYEVAGLTKKKMFSFAFITKPPLELPEPDFGQGPFTMTCMARLIPRKGIDNLFDALARHCDVNWRLVLRGDGPLREVLHAQAARLGIGDRVEWAGVVPNAEAAAQLAKSDLYVQPSRFDGWGTCVNEALLRGVPVICSALCGSADVMTAPILGSVFRAYDVDDLSRALDREFKIGKLTPERRAHILEWSTRLSAETNAEYVERIIDFTAHAKGTRPKAPWEQA